MNQKIWVSVSDKLKESVLSGFEKYGAYLQRALVEADDENLSGCFAIVRALDAAYYDFDDLERRFISEVFALDFISLFQDETWLGRLWGSNLPDRYYACCLYGASMVAEYIYGGIDNISLAGMADSWGFSEAEGQEIYDGFWTKTIEFYKNTGN